MFSLTTIDRLSFYYVVSNRFNLNTDNGQYAWYQIHKWSYHEENKGMKSQNKRTEQYPFLGRHH
jgi:hypothetical protein